MQSRRQFMGFGSAAVTSLLPPKNPDCRTSRRRRSASSICSSRAGHRRSTCSTTSRRSRNCRDRPARVHPHGSAADAMTAAQTTFPVAPSRFRFAQHGASRGMGQRTAAAHGEIADDSASSGRCTRRRSTTIRPSRSSRPAPRSPAGRASAPGSLRARQRERGPACLRRDDLARADSGDQPLYDRLWGSGFLPTRYQGVKFRSGGDPVLYLSNPPGIDATRDGVSSTTSVNSIAQGWRKPAIRRSRPASRNTRWRSACKRRCRS